jgi:hypothetical protein
MHSQAIRNATGGEQSSFYIRHSGLALIIKYLEYVNLSVFQKKYSRRSHRDQIATAEVGIKTVERRDVTELPHALLLYALDLRSISFELSRAIEDGVRVSMG